MESIYRSLDPEQPLKVRMKSGGVLRSSTVSEGQGLSVVVGRRFHCLTVDSLFPPTKLAFGYS